MAKHNGELIADIDDGYSKLANIFHEALACVPLSGAEHRVVHFIMRRTYGWAKSGDRNSGKLDVMSASEISDGTGLIKSYVHKCISKLVHKKVILAVKTSADNTMAYGMNTVIEEWGNGDKEWSTAKVIMRDAQDNGRYVNNGGYRQNDSTPTYPLDKLTPNPLDNMNPNPLDNMNPDSCPVSPCVSTPDGVSTTSLTTSLTDINNNPPTIPPFASEENPSSAKHGDSPQRLLFNGETPTPKTAAKKQRKSDDDWITPKDATDENKAQQTIRFAFTELLKKDYRYKRKGFSALIETVNTYGADIIHEWVDTIGRLVIPEGADEWKYFTMSFNNAARRPFEWRNKKPTDIYIPHKTPKTNEWGEVIPE